MISSQGTTAPSALVEVLADTARIEARCMAASAVPTLPALAELSDQVLSRARWQVVIEPGVLAHPSTPAWLHAARARRVEVRVHPGASGTLAVADAHSAALPVTDTAVRVVRDPTLVAAARQFFDVVWAQAMPCADAMPLAHLTPTQRRVLALLAAGHRDETIARRLGVTPRTVRRHVADLLDRLGAATRFQAAVRAARHGLIP